MQPLAIWLTCVCRPTPCMVASNCGPRRLGLYWSRAPGLLPVSAASPSMDHEHGTVCQPILEHQIRLCVPSSVISRPTCFSSSLRCCWQVGSAPFVRRRYDCLASSVPFTNIQTYLLTYPRGGGIITDRCFPGRGRRRLVEGSRRRGWLRYLLAGDAAQPSRPHRAHPRSRAAMAGLRDRRRTGGRISSTLGGRSLCRRVHPSDYSSVFVWSKCAPCGLRDWKNRPVPFPGRMTYKMRLNQALSVLSLSIVFWVCFLLFIRATFLCCVNLCLYCILSLGCSG